jgi:hypothetical protein
VPELEAILVRHLQVSSSKELGQMKWPADILRTQGEVLLSQPSEELDALKLLFSR